MPFQKGKPRASGAGRKPGVPNKATADVKALAEQHTAGCIAILWKIASNDSEDSKARIAAINSLLDRGHGKPNQSMLLSGDKDNPIALKINEVIVRTRQEAAEYLKQTSDQ